MRTSPTLTAILCGITVGVLTVALAVHFRLLPVGDGDGPLGAVLGTPAGLAAFYASRLFLDGGAPLG